MNFPRAAERTQPPQVRALHQHTQSVGATGGVYKGQGRIRRALMTQRLLGIPRSRLTIAIIYPRHSHRSQIARAFRRRGARWDD